MKYLSLFSGIGGFELGIGDKGTCIGFSEIDQFAIKTYQSHFNHKNYGDITKIRTEELPDFDLLVGGFPCQSFSIAGKRRGFEDTRGTMFFEIARILKDKQPRLILLENVKGLLSHNKGDTFKTIITTLDELGYDIQWQLLNSKDFGVPQNRERIFIVGHLRGTPRPKVFPFTRTDTEGFALNKFSKTTYPREISRTLLARDYKDPKLVADFRYDEGLRIRKDFISPCLTSTHKESSISGAPLVFALKEQRTEEAKLFRKEYKKKFGKDFSPRRAKELTIREDNLANTITSTLSKEHFLLHNTNIRKLTPIECERLQGFPDNWTIGSDTQRYKQCGNAVTVNVIKSIVDRF